jgi:hypothetical protein
MGQGRILADGPISEVFTRADLLKQTFLEPPQITQLAQGAAHLGFDPGTLSVESMLAQFDKLG